MESSNGWPLVRVVGVDASLTATGVAYCIQGKFDCHVIRSFPADGSVRDRIKAILASFEDTLLYRDIVVFEDFGMVSKFSRSSRNSTDRLELLGAMKFIASRKTGLPYLIVTPTSLKKFFTGNGGASKAEMKRAASSIVGKTIRDDNIADAIGLVVFGRAMLGIGSHRTSDVSYVVSLDAEKSNNSSALFSILEKINLT